MKIPNNPKMISFSKYRHINDVCILIYKNKGYTPLEAIEELKKIIGEYKYTYAGRLDPMAEGYMHIIYGKNIDTQEKNKIQNLNKKYQIEIILGLKSDTGDFFGIIENDYNSYKYTKQEIIQNINKYIGKFEYPYPKFSSIGLNNKNKIKTGDILNIKLLENKIQNIENDINKNLNLAKKLKGFRNNDIENSWNDIFKKNTEFQIIKLEVYCTSGVFMRTLAEKLNGICLSIMRLNFDND